MTRKLSEVEKRLLNSLVAFRSEWAPRPVLERVTRQTSGLNWRIVALRQAGYSIENKLEYHSRKRKSFYRII